METTLTTDKNNFFCGGERAQVRPSRRSWKILFEVKYSALFLCVALAGCTTPLLSPRLRLAEDSIPLADIVVGADPAERVRFAAGELKHGPIALIENGLPVFVIVPTPRRPLLHAKVISNLQEVRSRGANLVVIAEEGDAEVLKYADESKVFWAPRTTPTLMMPLVTVIPLQIFACEIAKAKGYDVDKPRNLAKSVTVE
jgi:hypothetical protein